MVSSWEPRRFHNHILKALRRAYQQAPTRAKVLKEAYVGKKKNPHTGRMISWYLCNDCGIEHMKHDVQVDHKLPVVPVTGWISWDETIKRLFCDEKDLQVLCKDCHHKKSAEENSKRKRPVRKKKPVPRLRPTRLRKKKQ